MLQVYFLLVTANILGGMSLASEYLKEKFPNSSPFLELLEGQNFQGFLGVGTFMVGFFGLFAVMKEDSTPILANLVPSFSALVVGTGLVLYYYQRKSDVQAGLVDKLDTIILKNRSTLGIAGIAAGAVHFFFPLVILL